MPRKVMTSSSAGGLCCGCRCASTSGSAAMASGTAASTESSAMTPAKAVRRIIASALGAADQQLGQRDHAHLLGADLLVLLGHHLDGVEDLVLGVFGRQ